jgi:hypothetical protein
MSQVANERANADDLLSAKLSQGGDSTATDPNFWRLEGSLSRGWAVGGWFWVSMKTRQDSSAKKKKTTKKQMDSTPREPQVLTSRFLTGAGETSRP